MDSVGVVHSPSVHTARNLSCRFLSQQFMRSSCLPFVCAAAYYCCILPQTVRASVSLLGLPLQFSLKTSSESTFFFCVPVAVWVRKLVGDILFAPSPLFLHSSFSLFPPLSPSISSLPHHSALAHISTCLSRRGWKLGASEKNCLPTLRFEDSFFFLKKFPTLGGSQS